jgi:hypothetical protein
MSIQRYSCLGRTSSLTNILTSGAPLAINQQLVAPNNRARLYSNRSRTWCYIGRILARRYAHLIQFDKGAQHLDMQADGNPVLYKAGPVVAANAVWASGTNGMGHTAMLQNDGTFVVPSAVNKPVWATGTATRWPVAWVNGLRFNIHKAGYQQGFDQRCSDGSAFVTTRTWSYVDLTGFYASVVVGAFDTNKKLLWSKALLKATCGVNGYWRRCQMVGRRCSHPCPSLSRGSRARRSASQARR